MWTAKWILDSYEEGDNFVRWDLYMIYPQLRECFDEIEAISASQGRRKENLTLKQASGAWYAHCSRLVKG